MRGVAASFAFMWLFALFFYWTFPYDRLRDYIIQRVENTGPTGLTRPSGIKLQIAELSPSWLTGVNLTGVQVTQTPNTPDKAPTVLAFDELSLRVSLLSLLLGKKSVSFSGEVGEGEVSGAYSFDDDSTQVELEFDELNLRPTLLEGINGVPIYGQATGEIDITVDKDPTKSEGAIDLKLENSAFGNGKAEIKMFGSGFAIERAKAGTLEIKADIGNGIATVRRFNAKGEDLEVACNGTVRLLQPLRLSSPDLLVRIKINEGYKKKYGWVAGLYALAQLRPQTKKMLTTDKAFQFRLRGSFGGALQTIAAGEAPPPSG